MKHQDTPLLKTRGFGLSHISIFYISIIYVVLMFASLFLVAPLTHYFPIITAYDWLPFIPYYLVVALLLVHFLSSFYTVTLTDQDVVLSWFCFPFRRISVENLQLFCAVGNEREDVLCLTSRSVEEMALLEEKHLLRNFVTKCDVPHIRKKADWQNILARKYLNRMRRSPLGILRDKRILFMVMDPVTQSQIHNLYPHLEYKNYTGITTNKVNIFLKSTDVPCFWSPADPCFVDFQEDAVVLKTINEVKRKIFYTDIKTITRVDIFRPYEKFFPHHVPLLFLSVYSVEEMAQRARHSENCLLLQAYRYAEYEAKHWSVKKEDCCNLLYKAETVSKLRTLCKHAQWIDIADGWISDKPSVIVHSNDT